jgi:hypothetical protein
MTKRSDARLYSLPLRLLRRYADIKKRVAESLMASVDGNARWYLVEVPCVDAGGHWDGVGLGIEIQRAVEAHRIQESVGCSLDQ